MARNKLTNRQYAVPFALITSLFFMWGFARAILDVMNKHFQNELGISISQSALIQVTTYLGYFIMAIPAGLFINRFGYRRGVVMGLVIFGCGSLLFIPCATADTFYAFLLALFVIGCGLTFLETSANPYATELGPRETATSRLNFSQSFNGLGGMAATLGVGQFLFSSHGDGGGSVVVPYAIMGVLVLLVAVVFSRVKLPEIKHDDTNTGSGGHNLRLLFHNRFFLFGLGALLAYEVAEISINSYFINFVTGQGWMSDSTAAMCITCALAIFMVGRFAGSWIMRSVSATTMLTLCAMGSVACMLLVLIGVKTVSLPALLLNYLCEAIMFPTIFSLALANLGSLTKSASSILMMTPVGGCGFLLMGLIADSGYTSLPYIVPLTGFVVVLAFAITCKRRNKGLQ